MKKHKKAGRVGLRIVLGSAGGLLLGFGIRDVLLDILPLEWQSPWIMMVLGFVLLFIAATKI